jgi:hypothetical protein
MDSSQSSYFAALKIFLLRLIAYGLVCQERRLVFIGMFFAVAHSSMATALKLAHQSGETNPMTAEADYSMHTLWQLLKARHGFDGDGYANSERWIEEEIQKRCARFQESTKRKASQSDTKRSASRYRPYGLMLGVFFLVVSSGPFLAIGLLDAINVMTDVNGDNALLSGVWAVLTLPFAVTVFLIGGIMDAERIVKWFNL